MTSVPMGSPDRLAEVDRELDAFGKSDDALAAARGLARELAGSARDGGLEGIDAVLVALSEGVRIATPPAAERAAEERVVETQAPPGTSARPARWDEPSPSLDDVPEDASGLVELPVEQLRREELPPVLSLGEPSLEESALEEASLGAAPPSRDSIEIEVSEPSEAEPSPAERSALELELSADLEAAAEAAPASGGGLESLFDDAPPPPADEPTSVGGLADLFEDDGADEGRSEAEPAAHLGLADLLTPELQAELAAQPDGADHGSAEEESTSIFSAADVRSITGRPAESLESELEPRAPDLEPALERSSSGEFELMIDEDVLELDAEDAGSDEHEAPPPPEPVAKKPTIPPPVPSGSVLPPAGSQPPPDQKGFFSRILNRK